MTAFKSGIFRYDSKPFSNSTTLKLGHIRVLGLLSPVTSKPLPIQCGTSDHSVGVIVYLFKKRHICVWRMRIDISNMYRVKLVSAFIVSTVLVPIITIQPTILTKFCTFILYNRSSGWYDVVYIVWMFAVLSFPEFLCHCFKNWWMVSQRDRIVLCFNWSRVVFMRPLEPNM